MKTKYILILLLSLIVISCSDEISDAENYNNPLTTTKISIEASNQTYKKNNRNFMDIEVEESPDISMLSSYLGIKDLSYDPSRKVVLDMENSIILMPYISKYDSADNYPIVSYGIKIARKKPKSGCKSCVDCIGFRCSFSGAELIDSEIAYQKLNDKNKDETLSIDRKQNFYVIVNSAKKVLEFHSLHNMNWEKLK